MTHIARLALLALSLGACAGAAPPPTPQIIYVTPPPVGAQPTLDPIASAMVADLLSFSLPTPVPTSPPVPREVGTPWFDYLNWSGPAFSALSQVMEAGSEGDFMATAASGAPVVAQQLGWLEDHQPMACYAAVHSTHTLQLTYVQDSFDAIDDLDFEAALADLEQANATADLWTALIDNVDCV